MKLIIATIFLTYASFVYSAPKFLSNIPLSCESIDSELADIITPKGFSVTPLQAHKIAMKTSNIIKPCASKLLQVIYVDSEFYYFTNSVLTMSKTGFTEKAVKINGKSGDAKSGF